MRADGKLRLLGPRDFHDSVSGINAMDQLPGVFESWILRSPPYATRYDEEMFCEAEIPRLRSMYAIVSRHVGLTGRYTK